jgi:uncharacterized protein
VDLPGLSSRGRRTTLKADPHVQLALLDVQALDSRIDSLSHQLGSIPEAQQLKELNLRRTQTDNGVRDLRIRVDDLTAEQKRADADVEQVKTRRQRDQGMIDSGQIGDPKALERMLDELKSLQRRITELEDTELEVMEELEATQAHLDHETAAIASLDEERARLEQALEEKAADLQQQLAEARTERGTTATGLPEDLMTLYARLREQKGGVGAAALRRRECEGCRLALNASDLSVIGKAAADEVLRCEECNRILVRTPESGL